jgi:hypothetical protein
LGRFGQLMAVPKNKNYLSTLESGIYVGQRINIGHQNFDKKKKRRALNKRGKLENIHGPFKKIQNLKNVGPT